MAANSRVKGADFFQEKTTEAVERGCTLLVTAAVSYLTHL